MTAYYHWDIDVSWHGDLVWRQTVIDRWGEVVVTIGDIVTAESIRHVQVAGYEVVQL